MKSLFRKFPSKRNKVKMCILMENKFIKAVTFMKCTDGLISFPKTQY